MNSTFTNTLLVIILVLLVGFGVWYFTARDTAPAGDEGTGIHVDIGGSGDGGTPDPQPGGY